MGLEHLYTVQEVAEYVGISYQYMRDCFAEGLLPEPRTYKKHKNKTTRKFTAQEAEALKMIFANPDTAKFKAARRRAQMRKAIREGGQKGT